MSTTGTQKRQLVNASYWTDSRHDKAGTQCNEAKNFPMLRNIIFIPTNLVRF
jgi:hypothetical protein